MLSCHFADKVRRNLGGIRKGFSKHMGELWHHGPGICFADIELRVLCSEMLCNFLGVGCFIIALFLHTDGKALDLPLV